jgi:hypothetical protein
MRVYRSDGSFGQSAKGELPRPNNIVSMSPPSYPSAWSHPCGAKNVPCVSFEIKDDCLDMLSDNDSTQGTEPFVTIHFDVATTDRAFSKAGLLAVADLLLGPLWDLKLSPLKVSAGVMPFNIAHRMMV